jgi:hypothetical protein
MMEYQLDRAVPVVVLRNLAMMEQFTHGAYRGPDSQALSGPAREAPAGAGAAGQLAAFLGRAV